MRAPTLFELNGIVGRFDQKAIDAGLEMQDPMSPKMNYLIGGEWVKVEELLRRLVRRCVELERERQGNP